MKILENEVSQNFFELCEIFLWFRVSRFFVSTLVYEDYVGGGGGGRGHAEFL